MHVFFIKMYVIRVQRNEGFMYRPALIGLWS